MMRSASRCPSASEAAIRRDFSSGKRNQGKGRQEHLTKTAQMTTAALNANLDSLVDQACAISAVPDELDCRNREMDDAERSKQ